MGVAQDTQGEAKQFPLEVDMEWRNNALVATFLHPRSDDYPLKADNYPSIDIMHTIKEKGGLYIPTAFIGEKGGDVASFHSLVAFERTLRALEDGNLTFYYLDRGERKPRPSTAYVLDRPIEELLQEARAFFPDTLTQTSAAISGQGQVKDVT